METLQVDLFGVSLEVEGEFSPYLPGGPFEPPTEPDFEVERVLLDGADVTEMLGNLYTAQGIPALVAISNEACAQVERAAMRKPSYRAARNYVAPFVGAGA